MRAKYSSDISREQFEPIRALLESARKNTRPRSVDLYEVFCAVLHLLRTGCQWQALPNDFPKWRTVHAYFAIWSEPRDGVDAQSVKNTDTAALKGYDAGKKASGIKRATLQWTPKDCRMRLR